MVPAVTGAPGDGNSALASALQSELSRQGVALTDRRQWHLQGRRQGYRRRREGG